MRQLFTKEFMFENCGCYSSARLNSCSFMNEDQITLKSILESEISIKDKIWFVCNRLATKGENQQIAIRAAEIVLPIYEKLYSDNKAPREAIEAAKAFLLGTIGEDILLQKRADAYVYIPAAAAYAGATTAAYADAKYKKQLLDYLLSYCD